MIASTLATFCPDGRPCYVEFERDLIRRGVTIRHGEHSEAARFYSYGDLAESAGGLLGAVESFVDEVHRYEARGG